MYLFVNHCNSCNCIGSNWHAW